jgi:hypothetical protein
MFGFTLDNIINVSVGATIMFYNIGVNQAIDKLTLNKCSKTNLSIGTTFGAVTGFFYIYKAITN